MYHLNANILKRVTVLELRKNGALWKWSLMILVFSWDGNKYMYIFILAAALSFNRRELVMESKRLQLSERRLNWTLHWSTQLVPVPLQPLTDSVRTFDSLNESSAIEHHVSPFAAGHGAEMCPAEKELRGDHC